MRSRLRLALALGGACTLAAARADDACLTATPPAPMAPPAPLRFGITPALAGSAGSAQGSATAIDPAKEVSALEALRPDRRGLVVRLNRLFESDGAAGIRRFAAQGALQWRRGRGAPAVSPGHDVLLAVQ